MLKRSSLVFLFLIVALFNACESSAGDGLADPAPLAPQRVLLGVYRPEAEAGHDAAWPLLLEEHPGPTAATGVIFAAADGTAEYTTLHYEPTYRDWAHALAVELELDPDNLVEIAPGSALEAVRLTTGADFDHAGRRVYPGGRPPAIDPRELVDLGYGEGTVIYVRLSTFTATLFIDAEIIKTWPIATGKPSTPTPPGVYRVTRLKADPIWNWGGRSYPPGDPENGLGSRWVGINLPAYGMHGTNAPESIGSAASLGCIRSHNADIEEVFEYLELGDTIIWAE